MSTILVVDDRPTNRQFLTTLLSYGGHRLLEASDGAEALKLVREERPDLVISDILMPTMDGFEFAKSVRADPAIAATKIVFYTATYRATEAALLAKACGVSTVIAKPAEPQRVLDVVAEQLGQAPVQLIPRTGGDPGRGQSDEVELSSLGVSIADYVNNLRSIKAQLDTLVERGLELEQERERLRGISAKFAANTNELHAISSRLYSFIELGMDLAGERDPRRLVQVFTAAARRIVGAQSVTTLVLRSKEDQLEHAASDGLDAESARLVAAAPLDEGLVRAVLVSEKAIRRRALNREKVEGLPAGHPAASSVLAVPIGAPGKRHGVVLFTGKLGSEEFSEQDERIGQALAAQLSVMYENFELYNTLQRRAAQLQLEIAERVKAEQAATDAQARFAQIASSIRDVFFLIDLKCTQMLYVSPAYEEIWGRSCESLYADPMSWSACIHPEDREYALGKFLEAGGKFAYEYRIVRPDGEIRWIDVRGFPINDEAGQPYRTAGVAKDITEQRRRADELRESERRLSAMLGNVRMISMMLDREGRVTYCNDYLLSLTGWKREEVAGNDWFGLFIPQDDRGVKAVFADLLADAPSAWHHENEILTRSGERRLIRWNNTLLRSPAGEAIGTASLGEDITEQKRAEQQIARAQVHYRATFDQAAAGVTYTGLDGSFLRANPKLCEMLGYSATELEARNFADLTHPDDVAISRQMVQRLLAAKAGDLVPSFEKRYIRKDGSLLWAIVSVTLMRKADGSPECFLTMMQDITDRKRAEARAERLNRVYKVLSGINTLIVRAPEPDEMLRQSCRIAVEHGGFSVAWAGLLDAAGKEIQPVAWEGVGEDYLRSLPRRLADRAGLITRAVNEARPVISNDIAGDPRATMAAQALKLGSRAVVALPLIVGGQVRGALVLHAREKGFFDEQEMKLLLELAGDMSFAIDHHEKASKLDYLAYYDALTGLANRRLFNDRLQQALTQCGPGKHAALMVMDVERFKTVNDSFGREAGDQLLRQVGERLAHACGDANKLCRMGADQFAKMVTEFDSEEQLARLIRERCAQVFGDPFAVNGQEIRLSCKVGIAIFPDNAATPDELYAAAEAALKKAKAGGDTFLFFAPEMSARVAGRLALETQLRGAIERREFTLHYQPKVDLDRREIVGVEALLRWNSPDRGLVAPGEFISVLEETGLIREAGAWALGQAARDQRRWIERGLKAPRVAVNVSAIQLRQNDFVQTVKNALDEVAPGGGLDIEITESLLMDDLESNVAKLNAVRKLGVDVAIDDFGTGYCSLGYLAKLPVQVLKVDRSFIITMLKDPNATALVSMIITLAHSLRLKVVAEGVDQAEQEHLLRLLRCDEMQGYLFSKPVPPDALAAMLKPARPLALEHEAA